MATATKRPAPRSEPEEDDEDDNVVASGAIFSPPGIVCFPHVWEPHSFRPGQDPNFSVILCFPEDIDLSELKKAVQDASIAKFGKDEVRNLIKKKKWNWPWRDGEEYADYGDPFVEGSTFISFKSKNAPGIVDEWARPIEDQRLFYAGCMARVTALPWPYDTMGNQGCTFLLNNIQKTDDGTPLAEGRRDASEEFKPVKKGAPPATKGFSATKGGTAAGKGGKAPPSAAFDEDDEDDIPF